MTTEHRHHHHVDTCEHLQRMDATHGQQVAIERCKCGARRDVMFGGRRGPWVARRGAMVGEGR